LKLTYILLNINHKCNNYLEFRTKKFSRGSSLALACFGIGNSNNKKKQRKIYYSFSFFFLNRKALPFTAFPKVLSPSLGSLRCTELYALPYEDHTLLCTFASSISCLRNTYPFYFPLFLAVKI